MCAIVNPPLILIGGGNNFNYIDLSDADRSNFGHRRQVDLMAEVSIRRKQWQPGRDCDQMVERLPGANVACPAVRGRCDGRHQSSISWRTASKVSGVESVIPSLPTNLTFWLTDINTLYDATVDTEKENNCQNNTWKVSLSPKYEVWQNVRKCSNVQWWMIIRRSKLKCTLAALSSKIKRCPDKMPLDKMPPDKIPPTVECFFF